MGNLVIWGKQNNRDENFSGDEVKSLSRVQLFATPWTVAYQASLSMGFSRQEDQSGLPFLPQGIFLTQVSNPGLLHCRHILHPLSHQGRHLYNF